MPAEKKYKHLSTVFLSSKSPWSPFGAAPTFSSSLIETTSPEPPAPTPLPKATQRLRRRRRLSPTKAVACELYPPIGHPPKTTGTPKAMQRFVKELERRGVKKPSDDTLKRDLGRR